MILATRMTTQDYQLRVFRRNDFGYRSRRKGITWVAHFGVAGFDEEQGARKGGGASI
jgi:hypothetical protein